jgi:hypothetical protein
MSTTKKHDAVASFGNCWPSLFSREKGDTSVQGVQWASRAQNVGAG